jgi:hypothetical protein
MPEYPKPPIENMPPAEGVAPPTDEEEAGVADDFLDEEEAEADETVDNHERDE